MTNCPNCGAPIVAPVCEYCGTVHRGFRAMTPGIMDDGWDITKIDQYLSYGAITPNEARELVGLSRIDESHLIGTYKVDQLYQQAIQAMRKYTE